MVIKLVVVVPYAYIAVVHVRPVLFPCLGEEEVAAFVLLLERLLFLLFLLSPL
jgi:hypothetical protein